MSWPFLGNLIILAGAQHFSQDCMWHQWRLRSSCALKVARDQNAVTHCHLLPWCGGDCFSFYHRWLYHKVWPVVSSLFAKHNFKYSRDLELNQLIVNPQKEFCWIFWEKISKVWWSVVAEHANFWSRDRKWHQLDVTIFIYILLFYRYITATHLLMTSWQKQE